MKIETINFIQESSLPCADARINAPIRIRQASDTAEIAARPWDYKFAQAISQEPQYEPIKFDKSLGDRWQEHLR
jgi:hypothetical protein